MKQFALLLFIILTCNHILLPAQDTSFVRAVELINKQLAKNERSNAVYITAENRRYSIINKRKQYQQFNIFELPNETNDRPNKKNGIELVACDVKLHAPSAWIDFYTVTRQVAFIKLGCKTPISELEDIYKAFMHLKSLCRKS